jgi:biotin synthase-like enzyme
MVKEVFFERAIFLSWYCSKGDCKFCYMSTQKNKIKNSKLAKRRVETILAEALISKMCNWREEFLSGGFDSYTVEELVDITKKIYQITKRKQWLNIGDLTKNTIKKFMPYIEGVSGAVECANLNLREEICPSKPIKPIFEMFKSSKELGLKNSITIIIGLGETIEDVDSLIDMIKEYSIDRITFYALNPHEETIFNEGPTTEYYVEWIKKIRESFPELEIVAGSWVDRLSEIHELLNAGANQITKFPSIRLFNTKYAKTIEEEVKKSNNKFVSNLTKMPLENPKDLLEKIDIDNILKEKILIKANMYLKKMKSNE